MLVGDRFEKNGKHYEVTQILPNGNYAFKKIDVLPAIAPVEETVEEKEQEIKADKKANRGKKRI